MKRADVVGSTPHDGTLQLSWLARLIVAHAPEEVAEAITALAQARPGCVAASVLWGLDGAASGPDGLPAPFAAADGPWLAAASRTDGPHWHPDRQRVAIRLCAQPEPAVLLLQLQAGHVDDGFFAELEAPLQLAGQHLRRALEWAELQDSHEQLERSESLQRALFAISDLAGSERDMPDMLRGIHAIVSTLMYAENFFIVLHDAAR